MFVKKPDNQNDYRLPDKLVSLGEAEKILKSVLTRVPSRPTLIS